MHTETVTFWYRFWAGGIIGPYFFENRVGQTITVNGKHYSMIVNGALDILRVQFEDIVNLRGGDVKWLSGS